MVIKSVNPLNDRVLVKPKSQGEQRKGAILIADMGEDRVMYGEVIAVGPGRLSEFGVWIPVENVKVGDNIIVPKIGAQRVEVDGEEYWMLAAKEIVATIDLEED